MENPISATGLKYRPDIDGLRAVAVLSVLTFHIGLSRAAGGFVGVDVFFVISGYLISSIIFSDIAGSRFSVIGFYERRIRRIFPALFAMLTVFSIFAAIYLLPSELVDYGKSTLAATAYVSNFYFRLHSGYFDAPLSQPLLHTWSLAVEEQFYILFPLFLVLVRRFFPKRLRISVVVLFFGSLLASAIIVEQNRAAAFYMPYTRAWELLLGTMLAIKIFPPMRSAWLRNVATFAGIGMIAFSVLRYTENTTFPGFSALVPCVGSALIIAAGEAGPSLVGNLLSCRPFVFIGLISYSLYLWSWPVVVLQTMGVLIGASVMPTYAHFAMLTAARFDKLVDIALSFLLAVLSWHFVERPFRSGRLRLTGKPLFALASTVMFIFMGASLCTLVAGGFKGRFPVNAVQVGSFDAGRGREDNSMRTGACFITTDYRFSDYNYNRCLHQEPHKQNYLLVGDSHSAMLWSALSSSLPNANMLQASTNACAPLLRPSGDADCRKMMAYIFNDYLPTHRVQGLFMAARWEEKDFGELTSTIAWVKKLGVPVTVFGPMPEYDSPLPRLLAYSLAWNEPGLPDHHRVESTRSMDMDMQNLADNTWRVRYVSLYRAICGADGCLEYANAEQTIPLMTDTNHLDRFGALLVVGRLVKDGELR